MLHHCGGIVPFRHDDNTSLLHRSGIGHANLTVVDMLTRCHVVRTEAGDHAMLKALLIALGIVRELRCTKTITFEIR